MSQGKARIVENENPRFGAWSSYWFLKIEWENEGEGGEEYWLITESERRRFERRAAVATGRTQGDAVRPLLCPGKIWLLEPPTHHRGVVSRVQNNGTTFGALPSYLAVRVVVVPGGIERWWLLTDANIIRIRYRAFRNHEDIDREREGWLADLLD